MTDDLISRAEAIRVASGYCHPANIPKELAKLPSAEPIIRCKDCKFYREYGYINGKPKFLPRCGFNQIYVAKDDFCSKAERRTDE